MSAQAVADSEASIEKLRAEIDQIRTEARIAQERLDLDREKNRRELQKLDLDIKEAKRPFFLKASFLAALTTVTVALLTGGYALFSGFFDAKGERLEAEAAKLEANIAEFELDEKVAERAAVAAQAQLAATNALLDQANALVAEAQRAQAEAAAQLELDSLTDRIDDLITADSPFDWNKLYEALPDLTERSEDVLGFLVAFRSSTNDLVSRARAAAIAYAVTLDPEWQERLLADGTAGITSRDNTYRLWELFAPHYAATLGEARILIANGCDFLASAFMQPAMDSFGNRNHDVVYAVNSCVSEDYLVGPWTLDDQQLLLVAEAAADYLFDPDPDQYYVLRYYAALVGSVSPFVGSLLFGTAWRDAGFPINWGEVATDIQRVMTELGGDLTAWGLTSAVASIDQWGRFVAANASRIEGIRGMAAADWPER